MLQLSSVAWCSSSLPCPRTPRLAGSARVRHVHGDPDCHVRIGTHDGRVARCPLAALVPQRGRLLNVTEKLRFFGVVTTYDSRLR